jgi:hypothetical protein
VEERFLQTSPNERHGWHPSDRALKRHLVLPLHAEYHKEGDSAKIGIFVYEPQIAVPSSLVVPDSTIANTLLNKRDSYELEHRWIEQVWLDEFHHFSQYFTIRTCSGSDDRPTVESCTSFDFKHPKSRDEMYTQMLIGAVIPFLGEHDYTEYRLLNIIPSHQDFLPQIERILSNQGYTPRLRKGNIDLSEYGFAKEKRRDWEAKTERGQRERELERELESRQRQEDWNNAM